MARKKRPLSLEERGILGGKARAAALSPRQLSRIGKKGAEAAAIARAACEHEPETRFGPTGQKLPGKYCKRCRRKLT